jgi:hypothetical protein
MNERVLESSVVVFTAVVTTVVILGIPVAIGVVFPYGRFSPGESLAILRVGAPFLVFFGVAFLAKRTLGTNED